MILSKTGTSTIQCELTFFQDELYNNASVAFIGRKYGPCRRKRRSKSVFDINTRDLIDKCFKYGIESPSCVKSEAWKILELQLEYYSQRNISVIISDEAFSRMLKGPRDEEDTVSNHALLSSLFNRYYPGQVHIVMVYRRYYEWLVSLWNNANKLSNGFGGVRKNYQNWPSEGGTMPVTFQTYYETDERWGRYRSVHPGYELHPVEYLQRLWGNYTNYIHVMNMHEMAAESIEDGEGMSSKFLRRVLHSPTAADTIAELKKQGADKNVGRSNPSVNIDFDLLAIEAHKQGYLNATDYKRHEVVFLTERYLIQYIEKQNNTSELADEDGQSYQPPMICLTEEQQEALLQDSIVCEQHMQSSGLLKPSQSQTNEEESRHHEQSFFEAVRKDKFCNMNVKEFVQNEIVQRFFQNLDSIEDMML